MKKAHYFYPVEAPAQEQEELPPHNIEAEQALLGIIFHRREALNEALVAGLNQRHFFEPLHERIFEVMHELVTNGKAISPIIVGNRLADEPNIGKITVKEYLERLANASYGSRRELVENYSDVIRDHAMRRKLLLLGENLQKESRNMEIPVVETTGWVSDVLTNVISSKTGESTSASLGDIAQGIVDDAENDAPDTTIPTGLEDLDDLFGGFRKEPEYIILSGRPSMGKSTLGPVFAYNVAKKGGGVFYVSLEMTRRQLGARLMSRFLFNKDAPIPYENILRRKVPKWSRHRLRDAQERLNKLPIVIDDETSLTCAEIAARCQLQASKFAQEGKELRLVVIDHMGLITPPATYAGNKVTETGEVSRLIFALSKRLGIPVLALHQMSRKNEGRENKRPELSDLRDSGNVEQDADTVMFVYRPEYYLRTPLDNPEEEIERQELQEAQRDKLEILLPKQRHGATGYVVTYISIENNVIRDWPRKLA